MCDCVISAWCCQVCDVLFKCGCAKIVRARHYIVTSVLSLADSTLEKAFFDSLKLDLGLVSASSDGIEP